MRMKNCYHYQYHYHHLHHNHLHHNYLHHNHHHHHHHHDHQHQHHHHHHHHHHRIGIWKCWFLRNGKNQSTQRKTSWNKERTNNKLSPHDAWSGSQTRATLEGGERSHHCAIPAPTCIAVSRYHSLVWVLPLGLNIPLGCSLGFGALTNSSMGFLIQLLNLQLQESQPK